MDRSRRGRQRRREDRDQRRSCPWCSRTGRWCCPIGDFEFLPDKVKTTGKVCQHVVGRPLDRRRRLLRQAAQGPDDVVRLRRQDRQGLSGVPSLAAETPRRRSSGTASTSRGRTPRRPTAGPLHAGSEDRGITWSEPIPVDGERPEERLPVPAGRRRQPGRRRRRELVRHRATAKEGLQVPPVLLGLGGRRKDVPDAREGCPRRISDPEGRRQHDLRRTVRPEPQGRPSSRSSRRASRWQSGGDYMGLAADKDGDFHPLLGGLANRGLSRSTRRTSRSFVPEEVTPGGEAAPRRPRPRTAREGAPRRKGSRSSSTRRATTREDKRRRSRFV